MAMRDPATEGQLALTMIALAIILVFGICMVMITFQDAEQNIMEEIRNVE